MKDDYIVSEKTEVRGNLRLSKLVKMSACVLGCLCFTGFVKSPFLEPDHFYRILLSN